MSLDLAPLIVLRHHLFHGRPLRTFCHYSHWVDSIFMFISFCSNVVIILFLLVWKVYNNYPLWILSDLGVCFYLFIFLQQMFAFNELCVLSEFLWQLHFCLCICDFVPDLKAAFYWVTKLIFVQPFTEHSWKI